MKISYNWLKQFLKVDWEAEKTGELLTDLGLEVEGIETVESIKGSLEGVVIGKVLTCIQHPNADRLKITTVNIGTGEPVQIVCGAPNVAEGQTVPVATIGTMLYDDKGEGFKIKKGKIRGEESHGMICAEDELGLGASHEGILVLDDSLIAGTPASKVFDVESDQVFEIGLTPNRADAMSHLGTARDLRAGLIQNKVSLELISPSVSHFHVDDRTLKFDVIVEDSEKAPRYAGVTISGITVKESPDYIKNRLKEDEYILIIYNAETKEIQLAKKENYQYFFKNYNNTVPEEEIEKDIQSIKRFLAGSCYIWIESNGDRNRHLVKPYTNTQH